MNNRSPVILDIDGTLADFARPFYHAIGRVYRPDAHTSWEFADLSPGKLADAWSVVRTTPWWWWALPPLTDAFVRIDALCQTRPVYFVTAREVGTPEVLFQTTCWLRCMGIESPCVIRTSEKGKLAGLLRAGWLLDDMPEQVFDTLTFSPSTRPYLLLRPYNVSNVLVVKGYGGEVVNSVEEFLKEVEGG